MKDKNENKIKLKRYIIFKKNKKKMCVCKQARARVWGHELLGSIQTLWMQQY